MGAGWYVALERESPGVGGALPHGGRALTFAQHHLDEISRRLGLPLMKDFFSSDPEVVAAYLRGQGIETDADELEAEEWFDAGEILPVARRLLAELDMPPVGMGGIDKARIDLAELIAILERAVVAGVRVHVATGLPDLKSET